MGNNLITIDKSIYESLKGELVKLKQKVSQLEEKLCQQEVEFGYAADNVPGMIYKFQLDKDGTMSFPYVSSRCWEFYELEPQEVKQNPQLLFELIHDDDFLRLQETINISAQTLQKWELEWRIKTSSGKQKWLYGVSQPVVQSGGNVVWDGCVIDISRRVLAMEDLQQREALLNGMKNATSCLLTTQDYDTSINTALAELGKATESDRIYIFENSSHQVTKELFLSQRWGWVADGVNSEQDYPWLQNLSYNDFSPLWYECLSQGESIITVEDESQFQGSRSIFVVPIQVKGKWWGFIGFEDYTTLRQWSDAYKSVLQAFAMNLGGAIATHESECELKQLLRDLELRVKERTNTLADTETRLKRLAANVPGMLYQYQLYNNGDVRLSYVSDGCRELVELEPEQIRRNPDIFTNTIHHKDVVGFNQSMADCIPTLKNWEYEWRIITPSGKEKWLQGFSRLEQHPNPPENIQEEIETVELEFLKQDFIKMLNSMKQGTQRIREIVLSLRNFSRLDEAEFKPVDIHEGIDSTLMILQNRLKAKPNFPEIEIVKNYASLPPIDCFPSQLNQVLMNILANAIDALESQKSLSTPQIQIHTKLLENNRVAIHLLDNGSGIPPQIQSKLFDPFFTTKEVGKGTGLGLSISYQIVVNKHGGNLSLFSTPGEGTEFIIEIPVNQIDN